MLQGQWKSRSGRTGRMRPALAVAGLSRDPFLHVLPAVAHGIADTFDPETLFARVAIAVRRLRRAGS